MKPSHTQKHLAKDKAEVELISRWVSAAQKNPAFAKSVPLHLYLRRNLSAHTRNILARGAVT